MKPEKTMHMTSDILLHLEKKSGLKILTTEEEFLDILRLDRVIIYLSVDWSEQERVSRYIVYKVLCDLNEARTPVFQIDCSDQTKQYVINWLLEQNEDRKDLYYGGYGETLLIENGLIIDHIKYPGQLGMNKVKKKLTDWKYSR